MGDEQFPVESLHVLTFARAIGDNDPIFRDRDAARTAGLDDIAAPLTFVQASAHCDPDYPLRPRPGEPWFGSGREPGTRHPELTRTLHAEQHFEYHRQPLVGDELEGRMRVSEPWTKEGSRGVMELTVLETQWTDVATGEPVVTERIVSVFLPRAAGSE